MKLSWCEIMDKELKKNLWGAVGLTFIFVIGWVFGAITVPNTPQDDINDWKCSVTIQPDVNIVFADTNNLISELKIEMPCSEALAKNIATIK